MKKPIQALHLNVGDKVEVIPHPNNYLITELYIGQQGEVKRFAGEHTVVIVRIGERDVLCCVGELKVI